ncbi:HNH/ENDO VII superfamily nuclease with conserved GHE residues [Amycolatopsis tolypomycina]|uniref:HNH/ENDO VII superfamily nuclease with conserved GHE residues n=1 Tax=Amycolatopsis tolypomycina TaxID=208445 RepID=A0A1H4JN63_9PSEU|nr:GH-E family nuclease [Amycolatopsis tolypomycina]SEB47316.1 HNH/ENDO VII superfamily nuclease with conserved GHE residues [Amycolatopsis tolypomycina]
MPELGQTTDPKALIPGDPDAVFENARVLHERARDANTAGDALKRIDTGAWRGPAADKFHEDHQTEIPRWIGAGDSLDNAALALTDFANCLNWAQGQAAEAIALWQQGDTATRQAQADHDRAVADADTRTRANAEHGDPTVVQAPPFTDPGEAQRQAARDMLARARQQVTGEGDRCAEALRAEAALAPQDSRKQSDANFYGGIWDSIKGAGEALYTLVSDPAETVAAMAHNITHPVDTFKEMVAWDDWANGRGDRALGKVTGEMLVGLATFGGGKLLRERAGRHEPGDGEPKPDGHHGPDEPPTPAPRPIYEPTRNRVKLRASTERAVIRDATRTPDGQGFECEASGKIIPAEHNPDGSLTKVNPDTGKPDPNGMTVPKPGTYDMGHRPGQEWWRYKQEAEAGGYDRQRVIEDQNQSTRYRLEDRAANRSHKYELPP